MTVRIITKDLSREILYGPYERREANSLNILSGYASASVATRHLQSLASISSEFRLRLLIGMTRDGAVTKSSHLAFQRLVSEFYSDQFFCSYMPITVPIHSKIYIWKQNNTPIKAWCCS